MPSAREGSATTRARRRISCIFAGTDGASDLQALGVRGREAGPGPNHQTSCPRATLGHEGPGSTQDVGALAQADLPGEHDQLIRLIRRRDAVLHDHGIGHELAAHARRAGAHAGEGLAVQAGDEIGTPQHRRHEPRVSARERYERRAVDRRGRDENALAGHGHQRPLAQERPALGEVQVSHLTRRHRQERSRGSRGQPGGGQG